jgi:hypothetical protein
MWRRSIATRFIIALTFASFVPKRFRQRRGASKGANFEQTLSPSGFVSLVGVLFVHIRALDVLFSMVMGSTTVEKLH